MRSCSAGAFDRVLHRMEERGWINYRRNGISRGAMAYHMLELQSIYDPGAQQVVEIRQEERKRQDESGDPPADDLLESSQA